jgi:hypothetical protein
VNTEIIPEGNLYRVRRGDVVSDVLNRSRAADAARYGFNSAPEPRLFLPLQPSSGRR